jgi:hypothetical protein
MGGGVQGHKINLIGCGASGAYVPGPEEGEEQSNNQRFQKDSIPWSQSVNRLRNLTYLKMTYCKEHS